MRPIIVAALFAICVLALTACGEHDVAYVHRTSSVSAKWRKWCADRQGIVFLREQDGEVCCLKLSEFYANEGHMSCTKLQRRALGEEGL